MPKEIEVNIKLPNLDLLRCLVCTNYLSCAPIRALPDGSNICGRCSPPNNEVAYRLVAVETLLKETEFPCMFKRFGCTLKAAFNKVKQHEAECKHQPYSCALRMTSTGCTWKGSLLQIPEHFSNTHAEFTREDARFKLNLSQTKQGTLIVVGSNTLFMQYMYNAVTTALTYDIRFIASCAEDRYCKIHLKNDADPDYAVQVKGSKCTAYSDDFGDMPSPATLELRQLLQVLNNPEVIEVTFFVQEAPKDLLVDHDFLNSVKCGQCHVYMVPPIYNYRDTSICSNCAEKCDYNQCCEDKKLEVLSVGQNYPCRWESCNFVAESTKIRQHEKQCALRSVRCIFPHCSASFKLPSTVEHFQGHKCTYFEDSFTCSLNFDQPSKDNYMFTLIDESIYLLKLGFLMRNGCSNTLAIRWECNMRNCNVLYVFFKQHRCKCESKTFTVYETMTEEIEFSDLPHCFVLKDNITATFTVS